MVAVALQPAQATRAAPESVGPVQLGHSIDELPEQVRTRMLAAVPAHVAGRVPQPEVRAQVDDSGRERAELVDAGSSTARGAGRGTARRRARARRHGGELEPRRTARSSGARCARTSRPGAPRSPGAPRPPDGTGGAAAARHRCIRTRRRSRPGSPPVLHANSSPPASTGASPSPSQVIPPSGHGRESSERSPRSARTVGPGSRIVALSPQDTPGPVSPLTARSPPGTPPCARGC